MNLRPLLSTLGFCAAVLSSGLSAQNPATKHDSADVSVADYSFTSPGEFVRVFLQKGQVYRAEFSTSNLEIAVRTYPSGTPVFYSREEATGGASDRTVFLVYPRRDSEYEIGLSSLGDPVANFRLYRDIKASRRRQSVINQPGWEIGAEVAVGYHSGYRLNLDNPVNLSTQDNDDGGFDLEGCFSARSGPGGLKRFSGCALGIGWHARPGSSGVVWFYLEPRFQLFGGRPRGQSNNEIGVSFRGAFGLVGSGTNVNPILLAPGVYVARNIRKNLNGKGWGFTLGFSHLIITNLGKKSGEGSSSFGTQDANRISLAVGYYQ